MAPTATILLIMASQGALAPRLARSIRALARAPIFEYVGHQHVPQAWRPHIGAAQARYGFYCHRNAWYVKIRSKNHGGILPSIMAGERSHGASGGAPVRPIPPHECPYSRMLATDTCTKAVRRGEVIGAAGNDEFTIALGDMGQKQQKTLLAVCSYILFSTIFLSYIYIYIKWTPLMETFVS